MKISYENHTRHFKAEDTSGKVIPELEWILNNPDSTLKDLPEFIVSAEDSFFNTRGFFNFCVVTYLLKHHGVIYFIQTHTQLPEFTSVIEWVSVIHASIKLEKLRRAGGVKGMNNIKIINIDPRKHVKAQFFQK